MPQDSLRSVYKSFVPCGEGSKGVAECNTVKRTLTKSHKIKSQRNSSTSSSLEGERKEKDGKGSTEDLQVREVSRGAEKLNEVLDSFASRRRFNQKPEYIAKDLLKGALDLQESLTMLRKFQETSLHKAKSKKSDKGKPVGNDIMNFNQIDRYDHFQNPRSSNASSRDCYEELRDVIVESFSRNNLLPKNSVHEKSFASRKSLDFFTDVPSSSSSHSLSSDCSSSKIHYEKPKGPNLIAKLMGLEEVSSKHANSVSCIEMETKGPSRHFLDFDLPKTKKPQFVLQKPARERISLEEMMESMQFKVLVDKNGEPRHHSECLSPPIVIMKPLHLRSNYGGTEEKSSKSRSLMPVKMKDGYTSDSVRVAGERSSLTQLNEKSPARKAPKKLNDKQGDNNGDLPARLPRKITNNNQNNTSPVKTRHNRPLSPSMQKEEIVKKIDGVTKMAPDTRKQAELKPSARSRDSISGQDLIKSAVSKIIRPGNGSSVSKSQISRGKHTSTDNKTTPKTSLKTVSLEKNLKEEKHESNPSETTVESIPTADEFQMNLASIEPETIMTSTTLEQVLVEVTDDASRNPISDSCQCTEIYPCDLSPSIIEDVKDLEDSSCTPYQHVDAKKSFTNISSTCYFFLCSASFLSHANMLLNIETGDPVSSSIDCLRDHELEDPNLLLECAKEIMERKSTRCTMFPLDHHSRNLSLEELVSEISDVIEDLRSYSKSCGDNMGTDSMSSVLKRDLWRNGKTNGVWEMGWRNGFATAEVNEVAKDLQNLLLTELVDDAVREFMF